MKSFNFDDVDFCEAVLFFQWAAPVRSIVEFPVWGATLLTAGLFGGEKIDLNLPEIDSRAGDIYVAGKSIVRIEGVVGWKIDIWHYDDTGGFVKDTSGNDVGEHHIKGDIEGITEDTPFGFNSSLDTPYGHCDLVFKAAGPGLLFFDPEDCVEVKKYCQHPERYMYTRSTGPLS